MEIVIVNAIFGIFYCAFGDGQDYKWKNFKFSQCEFIKSARSGLFRQRLSVFTAFDHILFVIQTNPVFKGCDSYEIQCYDLFYSKMYKLERKINIGFGFKKILNTNDGRLHFFDCDLMDIVPNDLKSFYKVRNDKLIFGFVRLEKLSYSVPVVLIECMVKYYSLFQ